MRIKLTEEERRKRRCESSAKWTKAHPNYFVQYQNKWRRTPAGIAFLQRHNASTVKNNRWYCLVFYSRSENPSCACCGETELMFLAIDHINGGGNKQKREQKIGSMTWWLVKNNFPDGYQVLCHNCNLAKGFYGECPHKTRFSNPPKIDSELSLSKSE